MQILERERAGQTPGLSQVDFLANLILVSSKIPGFDWRDRRKQDYQAYLAATDRNVIVAEITDLLQGFPLGVSKTKFPQHRLEIFGFQQFTIWSLLGQLGLSEMSQILNQALPAVARLTFKTASPSVPEIWHAHLLAKLDKTNPVVPANSLVWLGRAADDGKKVLTLS